MAKPDLFRKEKSAYAKYKSFFDEVESLFRESENLTDEVKGIDSIELTKERIVFSLIFTRCQKLVVSILKLCSEGHGEDAGILVRTLFENSVQIRYINNHRLCDRFLAYFWVSVKTFYDHLEEHALSQKVVKDKEYQKWKYRVDENYKSVESKFRSKKGKIASRWIDKSLKEMAADLGEKGAYELVMGYHSSFTHCDPHGLAPFIKEGEETISFANIASFKDIELVLIQSKVLFAQIVSTWAISFNLALPELIEKYSKMRLV